MLSDRNVDVVYVATPTGLHAEHGTRVLGARKHLWCEKPLTARRQTTVDLLELSRRNSRSVCEGFMYLYHPQFRRLSEYVDGGRLGAILSITCRFGIPWLEHSGFRASAAAGGGALLYVGCYPISAVQALFPAQSQTLAYSRTFSQSGAEIDTGGFALMDLSGGAIAQLEWRFAASYRNEIEIWGDKASLFVDKIFSKTRDYVPVFRVRDSRGAESTDEGEAADPFVCMLQGFRAMLDDAAAVESERDRILRRADALEEIRSRAPVNVGLAPSPPA